MIEPGGLDVSVVASDLDLTSKILAGDVMSFELIMRRHNRRLCRIARGVLRNDADAEDAVQEAYLHAYQNLGSFQGKGPLSAWLAKITLNEALGRLRGAEAAAQGMSFDDPEKVEEANYMADLVSNLPTPEQNAARGELRLLLEAAIDALPDAYRIVFVLCGIEEMSVAETAECLKVEPATVKTRYHRARKILRQQLSHLMDSAVAEAFSFDGARCDRIVSEVLRRLPVRDRN